MNRELRIKAFQAQRAQRADRPYLAELLLDAAEHDPIEAPEPATERVFTSERGARLDDGNLRRRVLKPAAIRARLLAAEDVWKDPLKPESWIGFHTFRHTCASLLFESGKNVKQVASWLGHADPGFTLRTYVHLMDEGVGGAEFLDDALAVPAPRRGSRIRSAGTDRGHAARAGTDESARPAGIPS